MPKNILSDPGQIAKMPAIRFHPLSLCLYPFNRARLFAFFPLSALIIHPCFNGPSGQAFGNLVGPDPQREE
jgi:hypothetical protein